MNAVLNHKKDSKKGLKADKIDDFSHTEGDVIDLSEFTAHAVRDWLGRIGVKTLFIEPGNPCGYNESFNSKLRDEFSSARSSIR